MTQHQVLPTPTAVVEAVYLSHVRNMAGRMAEQSSRAIPPPERHRSVAMWLEVASCGCCKTQFGSGDFCLP